MKKIRIIILSLLLICIFQTGISCSAAYTTEYKDEADILNALGLFKGTESGYELGRPPSRTEALVMLIRLLGREAEAEASKDTHPFTDVPAWADRYVAWAYANRLTQGMSETIFDGGSNASARMFLTFVLRALGYDDNKGDFSYDEATDKAEEIGLISKGEYENSDSGFLRDDCVHICFEALKTKLKSGDLTLAEKLVSMGAVSKEDAEKYGLPA